MTRLRPAAGGTSPRHAEGGRPSPSPGGFRLRPVDTEVNPNKGPVANWNRMHNSPKGIFYYYNSLLFIDFSDIIPPSTLVLKKS